jgi:inosine-uridine nucleoside N-ribohydrolase
MRALLVVLAAGLCLAQEKVIFDTDSAFFNDDGAALVMLLQQPDKVDVLGLTLVPGNLWPSLGADYMIHVLDVMKKPAVPVYMGARAPLVHTRTMAEKESHEWGPISYLGAFGQEDKPAKHTSARRISRKLALDFMIEMISEAPTPVTVLAIGPMTNLAMVLRLRPDLEKKIGRLVFMGGSLHAPGPDGRLAEFNFWFDPEAAQIVLRSAIPQKIMFGNDICDHALLDKSHYEEIAAVKTPVTALFREDLGKRFAKKPDATTHIWDTLAAAYLLDPDFVTKHETDYLDVNTTFGKDYGAVMPLDRALVPDATPVEVMLDLNFEKFFGLYKMLLTRMP